MKSLLLMVCLRWWKSSSWRALFNFIIGHQAIKRTLKILMTLSDEC